MKIRKGLTDRQFIHLRNEMKFIAERKNIAPQAILDAMLSDFARKDMLDFEPSEHEALMNWLFAYEHSQPMRETIYSPPF